MDLGTVLVIIALVLAVLSLFVDHTLNSHRLLSAAVVLVAIGVLVGAGGISVR